MDIQTDKKLSPLTIEEWEKKSKPYYLTIKNIMDMKENKKYKILHIDRNFHDLVDNNTMGISKASYIFRNNYTSVFTKSNNINGTTKWIFDDGDTQTEETQWHVDLGHIWYPLQNGYVPPEDEQGIFEIGKYAGKHWTELPKNTYLGWRGPCILLKDVNSIGYIIN